ncbi:oligosaccharide flippase family protein [Planococcus chinensis]|uniref:Oligosaccharide flippase family protein n=1 Tax=Planococcus chinensis TaxID=272917 RepID=A0ABW4QEI7_9BACL
MNQLKVGASLSYLTLAITIIIALLYTPIMIRLIGQTEYGLYALIGSFAAYFNVMDMGIGNAVVRYVSGNRVIGDKNKEAKLNALFLVLYLLISLVVIIFGLLLLSYFESIFNNALTLHEIKKAKIMIIILVINFAFSFPLAIFGSIIQAYEKFVFLKVLGILRLILTPLIILPLLFFGYGIITMVLVTTTVNLIVLLFNVLYAFKYLKIKFIFGKIEFSYLKEILGYSFFVFLGIVVDQIYWNTDQFILGIMAGTVPVAVYAIAMQFISLYMQFSTSISGLFLPKVSMLVAKNTSNKELTKLMLRYGRLQFIILSYILIGFALYGQYFINIWAGEGYKEAFYIVLIIMSALIVPLIQNFGISILYAKNLQKFRSMNLLFISILNIIITIPLIKEFGIMGAASATAVSLIIGNTIIMNLYYHFKIGINIVVFWKGILKFFPSILMSFTIGVINKNILPNDSVIFFFVNVLVFSLIHFFVSWFLGMNEYEKNIIKNVSHQFKKIYNKVTKGRVHLE